MNNRALTMSLIMAVMAVFFVQSYVSSIEEEGKKKFGTEVLVLVANKDIKEMETLNETMLEFQIFPKKFIEPAAVVLEVQPDDEKVERVKSRTLKGMVGSITLVPLKKGEQVTYNKLTDPGLRTGLAPQVTPGRRAVTVPVNEITGVSKLVKPGDRVDLIAVIDGGGGKENRIAKTVLQDVVVLAAGRYVNNNVARSVEVDPFGGKERVRSLAEDFSFTAVTLEVEPAQAQMIALVTSSGDNFLTLSLRNNDDVDRVNIPSSILPDILGSDIGRIKFGQKK